MSSTPTRRRWPAARRAALFLLIAAVPLALLLGAAAGGYWHGPIAQWFNDPDPPAPDPQPASQPGQLWTCGMHPQVIQDRPGDCPICHMQLTPLKLDDAPPNSRQAAADPPAQPTTRPPDPPPAGRKIKYWWDPMMNPPYISDQPGVSPMGMELIPVYEDEAPAPTSTVTIDPAVVQNMGVRIAHATQQPLRRSIRLVGALQEAQPNIREVNLLVSGWIRRLYANTDGMLLQQGEPLFDLYSPQLNLAIEELIAARRAAASAPPTPDTAAARAEADALFQAAAAKLELWGLRGDQVGALAQLDRAPQTVTFTSPITGNLVDQTIVEGAAVQAGMPAMRIVDYTTLWLDARVFEQDLPFVQLGQAVTASFASEPGKTFQGQVIFIHPRVDPDTRTATVRIALPNPTLALRPGMYATVQLETELLPTATTVPREAVIDSGTRQLVFVPLEQGRFEPRTVRVGLTGDDGAVQILEGLEPGEPVVVSGQFLLDSESRLREAIQKFLAQKNHAAPAAAPPATPPAVPHHHAPATEDRP